MLIFSQEFRVNWAESSGKEHIRVDIQIDGRVAQRLCHRPTNLGLSCRGVYETEASLRPFKFSELVLTGASFKRLQ